jgi:hypothetical protein
MAECKTASEKHDARVLALEATHKSSKSADKKFTPPSYKKPGKPVFLDQVQQGDPEHADLFKQIEDLKKEVTPDVKTAFVKSLGADCFGAFGDGPIAIQNKLSGKTLD